MFIRNMLDKIVFGAALLLALQVPQLVKSYQQFIAGYYTATAEQVAAFETIATQHGFDSLQAMIDAHKQNEDLSVQSDAFHKQDTFNQYQDLQVLTQHFDGNNLLMQVWQMVQPHRRAYLEQAVSYFSPGLPMSLEGLLFGFIGGMLLNLIVMSPLYSLFWLWGKWRRRAPKVKPRPETMRTEPTLNRA